MWPTNPFKLPTSDDKWQMYRLTYALPALTTTFLIAPLAILQGIYAKHFGLPLTTIATVLLIARVFDAVTDPLIGYYSDWYYVRSGSRKPFVVCGGVLLVVSSYFLYIPVDLTLLKPLSGEVTTVSPTYFLGWFVTFYFGWTLFEIPHLAWASQLVNSSNEKNFIFSLRSAISWLGLLLFYAVPLLPIFETHEFTPHSLAIAVVCSSFLMILTLYLCVKFTPDNPIPSRVVTCDSRITKRAGLVRLIQEILRNRPLGLFLIAIFFSAMATSGMWFTLLFIYVDSYLLLGDYFAQASIISLVCGIVMISLWYRVANRIGKKATLILGLSMNAIGIFSTSLLTQGDAGFISLLVVIVLCYGVGITAIDAIAPSLLADIIDYSHWRFGGDRAATYFSLNSVVVKTAAAVGGALGLGVASSYGFDPVVEGYTTDNIFGLRLAISWIPTGIVFCSMALFLLNPINAHRHRLLRRRLDARVLRNNELGTVLHGAKRPEVQSLEAPYSPKKARTTES